ncbi:Spy/CpxP family protein refolding chaperone [Tenacibaculum aiptasiae]|uniref:Sensor of ECF-type sigma factor n=1 Tax=Tenacibaculum aiptasiae TaxID=426481 RepID=A0A7J5AAK5_9FLAO|nr:sensor of ECF-type sigma factor [Tenacibaculum aiptasiae]KAB1154592.1 sensor of ECF-type sigma factor [Tenacibaculum aiptasiae]
MKKLILTLIAFSFFATTANAQFKKSSEKIRLYKVSFLTEKLDLTASEAEKFWPIYNKYDKNMMELHREERVSIRKRIKENGGIENLSEKESKEILKNIRTINRQRYEIKAKFHNKISKILPYKKILALEMAEHDFHRSLFKKYKRKRMRK